MTTESRGSAVDQVRALFVPGEKIRCTENTYFRSHGPEREAKALRTWTVGTVGRSVWSPADDGNWRGTFPTRVRDVVSVSETAATWKIREDFTVTYERVTA